MALAGAQPPQRQEQKKKAPWCTIATLEFQLLTSPNKYKTGWQYNFTEHDRIEGKPTLQQVGGTLRVIDLDFQFHAEFCEPEKQLQQLIDLADKGEAVALVLGEKWQGYWVIEDIPLTVKRTDAEAGLYAIEVSIKLKEWIGVSLERKPKTETGFAQRDRTTFSGTLPSTENIA